MSVSPLEDNPHIDAMRALRDINQTSRKRSICKIVGIVRKGAKEILALLALLAIFWVVVAGIYGTVGFFWSLVEGNSAGSTTIQIDDGTPCPLCPAPEAGKKI